MKNKVTIDDIVKKTLAKDAVIEAAKRVMDMRTRHRDGLGLVPYNDECWDALNQALKDLAVLEEVPEHE